MTPCPSADPVQEADLNRHGLIEASAGTGKTHTIENLVVRLLKEEAPLGLENILLVTFTEKAASELKIRIREKIEAELRDPGLDPAIRSKLQLSVDEFDKAAIHTIHGFCQGVLRDFAFENGVPFRSEVIADPPLYETLLKEQMRKDWPVMYGDDLEQVLELSGFPEQRADFLKTVTDLAASFHPEAGDRLLPVLEPEFGKIKEKVVSAWTALKALVLPGFSERYEKLNFHAASKRTVLSRIVRPLEGYLSEAGGDGVDLSRLSRFMAEVDEVKSGERRGLECLIPLKWTKKGENLYECPELPSVKGALMRLNEEVKVLRCHLAVTSVRRLQADMARTKESRGWISYHDMLARVDRAISGGRSRALLESLRGRFKAAFIDEFQDTDPLQWRIFRKIFLEGARSSGVRLFLIGDPKQAIYGFRGADVYAYLSAKEEMEGLAKGGEAGVYSLRVNWRSAPPLIAAFNRLFGREAWFRPWASCRPFEIGYQPSEPPQEGLAPGRIIRDLSGRPPLNIMDLSESPSARAAKLYMAGFVAREIRRLMGADIRIEERGRGIRPLGFGDMAVLVRARSEASLLEDELKKGNIPYAYYRKPGLFASDEAVYVGLVFHAILDPSDGSAVKKALLTPFFGQGVRELYAYDEISPTHPLKEILFRWNGYAAARRWGALFQSLMEDSGLLARLAGTPGWDRAYANYRQIFEYLEGVAYRKNLDFRALCTLLDLYRDAAWEAEEGVDIHQIETESGKVQIMTMHVSKGLQFPVVFVAGGLTQKAAHGEAYHVYHPEVHNPEAGERRRVFDLLKSGGMGRHEQEKVDEDKRLYYVAATRARFKLYLPYYRYEKGGTWVGPVCTLLSPALVEAFPRDEAGGDVLWLTVGRPAAQEQQGRQAQPPPQGAAPPSLRFDDLVIPESYGDRRIQVVSFSSLHEATKRADEGPGEGLSFDPAPAQKEVDEPVTPWEGGGLSEAGLPPEMPGGTGVGLMFHGILERMDYGVVLRCGTDKGDAWKGLLDDPGTREIILEEMVANGVEDRWEEEVCRIIWNTLTATIPPLGSRFVLASLKPEDRVHEPAFYYPVLGGPEGLGPVPAKAGQRCLVRGFIDLVFRANGRYYVADWKSNLVEEGYDARSLERNMADAGYHLQYRLYAVATLRWLRQCLGDRFDPERHWGGVFYFYLRGMGGTGGSGIYFVPPKELGPLEALEGEVGRLLQGQPMGIVRPPFSLSPSLTPNQPLGSMP